MHVIVGQGRLDAILHASPEDRRSFIEGLPVSSSTAGKEKALRKLEQIQQNLQRLTDLSTGAGNSSHWGGRRRWHGGLPPFRPMSEMHG